MSTVYIVRSRVEPDHDEEWNRWQAEEHIPNLLALPGYVDVQRFVSDDGGDRQYMNVWRLESAEAFGTPDYRTASLTAWFERLRPHYAVTVDFGIERDETPGCSPPSPRGPVVALVVDRARTDGPGEPLPISTEHLEALRDSAGVVQVVVLDPLAPDHVRSMRDAPLSEVVLVGLSDPEAAGALPLPPGIERHMYLARDPAR